MVPTTPWKRRLLFGLAAGAVLWFVFGYHYTGHHVCFDCKTWVWFDRRGLGNPLGTHLELQNSVDECPSIARREFFPPDHVHRLVFGQSFNSWLFDGWICSLGTGASSDFTMRLNQDARFLEFIRAKIAAGSLTREQAAAMASVPRNWHQLDWNRRHFPIRETMADYAPAIDLESKLVAEYLKAGWSAEPGWVMGDRK